MKKKVLLHALELALVLSACGGSDTAGDSRGKADPDLLNEDIDNTEDDVTEADKPSADDGGESVQPTEAENEAVPTPTPTDEEYSFWEYEGFIDEAREWLAFDPEEFQNRDFDGDKENDRIYRKFDDELQMAYYSIVFGNGNTFNIPAAWYTGFPHIVSADLDKDGEEEILFTQSYDTSTDPTMAGDMWIFDPDGSGNYKEVALDCFRSEAHGERYLTVEYGEPGKDTIPFKVVQTGYEDEAIVGEDYIEGWWIPTESGDIHVCSADVVLSGGDTVIRCKAGIFSKSGLMIGFDLVYNDGKYEIKDMRFPAGWDW